MHACWDGHSSLDAHPISVHAFKAKDIMALVRVKKIDFFYLSTIVRGYKVVIIKVIRFRSRILFGR